MVSRPSSRSPIALTANSGWNIVNFRAGLIRRLIASGRQVLVLAPGDGHAEAIRALGAEFASIPVRGSSLDPLADIHLLRAYRRLLKRHRPSALLSFTVKPNIYGSLAARSLKIPVINNISGLGTAFISKGPLRKLVSRLYRLALRRSATVFFQNRDDRDLFLDEGLVKPAQARLIPGSGVDLEAFTPPPARARRAHFHFLFVGRLLRDKGVLEFVEAARIVRATHPKARFSLLGPVDSDNRTAISKHLVEHWVGEGAIDYLGATNDVRPYLADCDCVVLPSYREGLPRSLLEAAAMERPMIAADVPGCREVVRPGKTGLLCKARSANSLAEAMQRMLSLTVAERKAMGQEARRMVAADYGEAVVAKAYVDALEELKL